MDAALLTRLFGTDGRWHGPCTVILDANASVHAVGSDSFVSAGAKVYSPRIISSRVSADGVCLLDGGTTLVLITQMKIRQSTGEDRLQQTVTVADAARVVAVEFADASPLAALGLSPPAGKVATASTIG